MQRRCLKFQHRVKLGVRYVPQQIAEMVWRKLRYLISCVETALHLKDSLSISTERYEAMEKDYMDKMLWRSPMLFCLMMMKADFYKLCM